MQKKRVTSTIGLSCVLCGRQSMDVTTAKCAHLQISMPAEYVKELQDEELHSLGVLMLATRPNGEDTMTTVLSGYMG